MVIEDGLAEGRTLLDQHRARAQELGAAVARTQERSSEIPEELAGARAALGAAQRAAMGVAAAGAVLEAIAGQADAARRIPELSAAVDERRAGRRAARRAYEEADDHHKLLVDQRLADVRGELAARLVSGDPCLVCGSPEHPAPARGVTAGVSEEQVRRAVAHRDECRLVLDEAEVGLARAEADLDHATRTAGGLSTEQWQARIDQANAEMASGELAKAAVAGLEARVSELSSEQAEIGAELIALAEALAGAQAEVAHSAGRPRGRVRRRSWAPVGVTAAFASGPQPS